MIGQQNILLQYEVTSLYNLKKKRVNYHYISQINHFTQKIYLKDDTMENLYTSIIPSIILWCDQSSILHITGKPV